MQDYNWNDLKYVLALGRRGSLAAAGRQIGVSETTVARRLTGLANSLGGRLFIRGASGGYDLTELGQRIMALAERLEQDHLQLADITGRLSDRLFGTVRLTSVPVIINRLLLPHLGAFHTAFPGITLELVTESRNLDLRKREADLALRFARPASGGLQVRAQKLDALAFGVFAPASVAQDQQAALPWIGYEDQQAGLPQARWLAAVSRPAAGAADPLRVSDVETALEAVACGLGRSLLPVGIASKDPRLQPLSGDGLDPPPQRDIWLLSHGDDGRRSVSVTKDWLARCPWSARG